MKHKLTILIPTWNGKHILEKSLPDVLKYSPDCQIIIVDDGSSDGTVDFVSKEYPQILIARNKKNVGFTKSMNIGLKLVETPYVAFLNNDVYPTKNYLTRPLEILESDKTVSAVNFCEINSSWPVARFVDGKLAFDNSNDKSSEYEVLWPSGGSSVLRMSDVKSIGYYNEVYTPGYWEDIDLGWRIWKSGKKVLWTNKAVVIHEHETSFSKLDQNYISTIKQRNELLWHWLNISDKKMKLDHVMFLIKYTIAHPGYIRIIFNALLKLHSGTRPHIDTLSDREIFDQINHEYKK